jgi:hypothetical protein
MQKEVMRKILDHHRKEEIARGAQVHEEDLQDEIAYLEAVIREANGIGARFVFLGPSRMLDVRAKALTESDLESIRRSLKAVEWR